MFKPFYCCFGLFFRRTSFCSSRSVHPALQAVLCSPCIANVLNFLIQRRPTRTLFLFEFSGFYILFNLWFSRFFVVVCLSSNSFSISDVVLFVNNFFYLFFWTFWRFVPRSHGASIIIANVELNVNNFSKLFPNFFSFLRMCFHSENACPYTVTQTLLCTMSKFHEESPMQSCWSDLYDKEWRARYWSQSASKESFPRQLWQKQSATALQSRKKAGPAHRLK